MNILGVRLVLVAFGSFMIYVLFLRWKKRNVSNKFFGVWLLAWIIYLFFSIFPQLLDLLTKELFIVLVMDVAMIVTFMVLGYVRVENNIMKNQMEKKIEEFVRNIAVK
jgi:hypothetical protein